MTLVSRDGPSLANPSPASFSLSSLLFLLEEQVECLWDEALALVVSQLVWFYNKHMNQ